MSEKAISYFHVFRSSNDFILDFFSQIDEIDAISAHLDDNIPIAVSVFLNDF
ncbi:MAG: hypothetical protein ACTSUN_03610 [Promethearchaeota archaeon]